MADFLSQINRPLVCALLVYNAAVDKNRECYLPSSCVHKADLSTLGVRAPDPVVLFDNQHPSGNRSWKVRLRRDDV
jgi:hypothetical protein